MGRPDRHDIRLAPEAASLSEIQTPRTHQKSDSSESPLITMDGAVVGAPSYMPPEQAKGQVEQVDALSDIYALGAMLYTLLTGRSPYTEPEARLSPHTVLGMVIQGPPKSIQALNPRAPPELIAICEKAMAREKPKRYSTCLDLAGDLQAWIDRRVVKAYRTGAAAELKSWVVRNPATAFASAAVAVLLLAGLALISVKNAQLGQKEREATQQRNVARENLYDSLLREARATRAARRLGYRANVQRALEQARALDVPQKRLADLRSEWVACLGDFIGLEPIRLSGFPTNTFNTFISATQLDAQGRFAAIGFEDGTIQFHGLDPVGKLQEVKTTNAVRQIALSTSGGSMLTLHWEGKQDAKDSLASASFTLWLRSAPGAWEIAERRTMPGAIHAAESGGKFLVVTQDAEKEELAVFDWAALRALHRFQQSGIRDSVARVKLSKDQRYFASHHTRPGTRFQSGITI